MFTSNSPSGTQPVKRNSTDYDPSPTVNLPRAIPLDSLPNRLLDDTDLIMLCYSVDSKDSLENVESKWVGEIADNCPGTKLVLVALKCDLREQGEEDENAAPDAAAAAPHEKKPMITYDQGLEVARRIGALRYLECSAMKNRGVNEAFTEAARVALSVKKDREESKCVIM